MSAMVRQGYTLDEAKSQVAVNPLMMWFEPNGSFDSNGQALYRVNSKAFTQEHKYPNGYTLDEAKQKTLGDSSAYYEQNGNIDPNGQPLYRVNKKLS